MFSYPFNLVSVKSHGAQPFWITGTVDEGGRYPPKFMLRPGLGVEKHRSVAMENASLVISDRRNAYHDDLDIAANPPRLNETPTICVLSLLTFEFSRRALMSKCNHTCKDRNDIALNCQRIASINVNS